jgi:hypothetical protein
MENKNKKLNQIADEFLGLDKNQTNDEECQGEQCVVKTDKSIQERINKKIIVEDGRQLLT